MASIFDHPASACCPPGPCGAMPIRDPAVYLSPQSESVESPEFEVGSGRAIVRAFDLTIGAIRIEMVHGHAEAKRYALAMQNGIAWLLSPTHTLEVIEVPGRYRLVATGIVLGPQMPTVVVTDVPAGRASL
jgi:hypothetical protein